MFLCHITVKHTVMDYRLEVHKCIKKKSRHYIYGRKVYEKTCFLTKKEIRKVSKVNFIVSSLPWLKKMYSHLYVKGMLTRSFFPSLPLANNLSH